MDSQELAAWETVRHHVLGRFGPVAQWTAGLMANAHVETRQAMARDFGSSWQTTTEAFVFDVMFRQRLFHDLRKAVRFKSPQLKGFEVKDRRELSIELVGSMEPGSMRVLKWPEPAEKGSAMGLLYGTHRPGHVVLWYRADRSRLQSVMLGASAISLQPDQRPMLGARRVRPSMKIEHLLLVEVEDGATAIPPLQWNVLEQLGRRIDSRTARAEEKVLPWTLNSRQHLRLWTNHLHEVAGIGEPLPPLLAQAAVVAPVRRQRSTAPLPPISLRSVAG